ncbi:hypothetical protein H4V99_000927 [Cryobacterium sp. CG_9.6]|nr:hypothetical protein [Cryobacterium sp. CG_9.6]
MLIRLNPHLPLVWRSPDTIQVGVDRPVLVLAGLTSGLEAVLNGLRAGVPLSGAILLGTEAGASVQAVTRLLEQLGPALEDDPVRESRPHPTVVVDGVGPTAERIGLLLTDLGLAHPLATGTSAPAPPSLAVLIGHYVLKPDRHTYWLRRDVPHLPVIYSDTEVRIGPLVQPGSGPCLVCVELAHGDVDPAWPALSCQLSRRRAGTETPRLAIEVAARVAVFANDLLLRPGQHSNTLLGDSALFRDSVLLDATTGEVRRCVHLVHGRCACQALPENETVPDPIAAAGPASTSSGRVASWRV